MRKTLTSKQLRKINKAALSMVASANQEVSTYRQVTPRTAIAVVKRSLGKSEKLPFSIREHLAIRDVSDFISVMQNNKTNLQRRRNTDLLPVCHPASTKKHTMTASALRAERARWYAADKRIDDPEASALVASACSAEPFSAQQAYFLTRALNYPGIPLTALTAAFGGGNSRAARSARAKLQRRDRKGRFAWMGGGMSALVSRTGGGVSRLTGRAVAQGVGNDNTFDLETPDGKIYRVPAGSSEASRAYLPSDDAEGGYSPVEAKDVGGTPTVAEADLVEIDAPNGFRPQEYDGAGKQYTDDAYNVTKLDHDDPDQQEEIPDAFFQRDDSGRSLIDDDKPVYMVTREDGTPVDTDTPMQSWADVQDAIRVDEIIRDRQEGREPDPVATLDNESLNRVADIAEAEDRDPNQVAREILSGDRATEAGEAAEAEEFNDPTGFNLVSDDETYIPEGRTDQDSPDYTDDPAVLAQRFDEAELTQALRDAVTPGPNGEPAENGELDFEEGAEEVPAQALYDALKEKDSDAKEIMQGIYDDISPAEAADPEQEFFDEKPKSKDLNRKDPNQWTESYDGYTIDRWKDADGSTFYRANVEGGRSKNFVSERDARRFAGEEMGVFEKGLDKERARLDQEKRDKQKSEEWAARKPETGPEFSKSKDERGEDLFVETGEDYSITRSVDRITGRERFEGSWVKETRNKRTGEVTRERERFSSPNREDIVEQINRDKGGSWVSKERPEELPDKPEKPDNFWEQAPNSRTPGSEDGTYVDDYDDYTIERSKRGGEAYYTGSVKGGPSRTFETQAEAKNWVAEQLGVTDEKPTRAPEPETGPPPARISRGRKSRGAPVDITEEGQGYTLTSHDVERQEGEPYFTATWNKGGVDYQKNKEYSPRFETREEAAEWLNERLGEGWVPTETPEEARIPEPEPEPEPEAPEAKDLPELFDGLSEEEKADVVENGNYSDYLPENNTFDAPDGYYEIDPEPFENVEENPDVDPINLATDYETEDLKDGLAESLKPDASVSGVGTVSKIDEDGEESATSAPAEAIRDGLQMQGEDTNEFIESVYEEGREEPEPEPEPELEPETIEEPEAVEEPEAPSAEELDDADAERASESIDDFLDSLDETDDPATIEPDVPETPQLDTFFREFSTSDGKEYSVRTRRNPDGTVDVVITDSEGREFIESTGDESEIDELNERASGIADSMESEDEVGSLYKDLVDSEEPDINSQEEKSDEAEDIAEESGELDAENEEITSEIDPAFEERRPRRRDVVTSEVDPETMAPSKPEYPRQWPIDEVATGRFPGDNEQSERKDSEKRFVAQDGINTYSDEYLEHLFTSPADQLTDEEFSDLAQIWNQMGKEERKAFRARGREIFGVYLRRGFRFTEQSSFQGNKYDSDVDAPDGEDLEEGEVPGEFWPGEGQGRTEPNPEEGEPSRPIIPEQDFFYVDPGGKQTEVRFTKEYVNHIFTSNPKDLTDQEIADFLTMYNQMNSRDKKSYSKVKEAADREILERLNGVEEPITRYPGDRYRGDEEAEETIIPPQVVPSTPETGFVPPKPKPAETPVPGGSRKSELNRRSRAALKDLDDALRDLLDTGMPENFYPNLPQAERERMFNEMLADLEADLEQLRGAMREYIKTKEGSTENTEALNNIAALIDRSSRKLQRIERGSGKAPAPDERPRGFESTSNALGGFSDWVEDAIDPDWSPDPYEQEELFDIDSNKYQASDSDTDEESAERLASVIDDIADSIDPLTEDEKETKDSLLDQTRNMESFSPEDEAEISRFLDEAVRQMSVQEGVRSAENKQLLNNDYIKGNLKTLSKLIRDKDSDPKDIAYYANILNPVLNPDSPDSDLDNNPLVKAIRGNEDLKKSIEKGLKAKKVVYDPSNPSEPFRPAREDELPKRKPRKKPEAKREEESKAEKPAEEEKTTPETPEAEEAPKTEKPERELREIDPDDLEFPGEEFPPSREQREAISAILGGDMTVIRALAGAGKTTTLRLAADKIKEYYPDSEVLYIAFNKSIQIEASNKMPDNTTALTFDSISYNQLFDDPEWSFMVARMKDRTDPGLVRNRDIADHFGVENGRTQDGEEIGASQIVKVAMDAVQKYTVSDDDEISAKHFGTNEDGTPIDVSQEWVDLAKEIWADKTSKDGKLSITNGDITKRYGLNQPDMTQGGVDYPPMNIIFFDEAQDINPVIAKIIRDQEQYGAQIVYVGDSNQAIYKFRGAEDELDKIDAPNDLPLTESWRFGPEIASFANRFLGLKGSKYKVRGGGPEGEVVDRGTMTDPDAIITRTTLGKFVAVAEQLVMGKRVTTDVNSRKDLIDFVRSARNLRFGNGPVTHKDLRGYASWDEVIGSYREGKLEGRARQFFDMLMDKKGNEALEGTIGDLKVVYQEGVTANRYVEEITPDSIKFNTPEELYLEPVKEKRGKVRKTKQTPKKVKYVVDKRIDPETGQEVVDIYLYDQGMNNQARKFDAKRLGAVWRGEDSPVDSSTGVPRTRATKKKIKRDDGTEEIIEKPERDRGKVWQITAESEEDAIRVLNELRDSFQGIKKEDSEVSVITAHVSKGLEYDRVKIDDDFERFGPKVDEEGNKVMPSADEVNLAYVAATRAKKSLDPGGISWIYKETDESDESVLPSRDVRAGLLVSEETGLPNQGLLDITKNISLNPDAFLKKDPATAKKLLEKMKEVPGQDKDEIDRIIQVIDDKNRAQSSPLSPKQRKIQEKKNVDTLNKDLPEGQKISPEEAEKIVEEVEDPPDRIVAGLEQNLSQKTLGDGQWRIWSKDVLSPGPDGNRRRTRYEVIVQKNKDNSFSVVHRTHDVTREGQTDKTGLVDEQRTHFYPATQSYTYLRNTVGKALQEIQENSANPRDLVDFWNNKEDRELPDQEIRHPAVTHVSADGWTELEEGDRVYDHVNGRWGAVRIVRDYFPVKVRGESYEYTDYVAFQPDGSKDYSNAPAKNFFKVDPQTGNFIPTEGINEIPSYWKGPRETEVVPPSEGYDNPPMSTRKRRQLREAGARAVAEEERSSPEPTPELEPEPDTTPEPEEPAAPETPETVDSEEAQDAGEAADSIDSFLDDLDSIDIDPPSEDEEDLGDISGNWTPVSTGDYESETYRKLTDAALGLLTKNGTIARIKKTSRPSAEATVQAKVRNGEFSSDMSSDEFEAKVDELIDEKISVQTARVVNEYLKLMEKPKKIYKSSRGSTVSVTATGVSQEQVQTLLDAVDRLEALVDMPNMTYVITNKGLKQDGVAGQTVQSDHVMMIRPQILGEGSYEDLNFRHQKWMLERAANTKGTSLAARRKRESARIILNLPEDQLAERIRTGSREQFDEKSYEVGADGVLSILVHEMGHAVDDTWRMGEGIPEVTYRGKASEGKYKDQNPEGHQALLEYMNGQAKSYGKSDMAEAYAESFSNWVFSGGDPSDESVRKIAEAFGWNEKYQNVKRAKTNPSLIKPRGSADSAIRNLEADDADLKAPETSDEMLRPSRSRLSDEGEVSVDFLSSIPGNRVDPRIQGKGTEGDFDKEKAGEITLEFDPTNGRIYVGEGNHRVAAAKEAGVSYLPVKIVRTKISDDRVAAREKEGGNVGNVGSLDAPSTQEVFSPDEVLSEGESGDSSEALKSISSDLEGMNPEVFSADGTVLGGVSMVLIDDLPDRSRKFLEAYSENNNIDLDKISDLILQSLANEDTREAGKNWYSKEFRDNAVAISERTGYPVDTVTAVIAITSARNAWARSGGKKPNLELAEAFLNAHKEGKFEGVTTPEQARKVPMGYLMGNGFGLNVIKMLNGDISIDEAVTGTKRRSFYNNGLSPETSEHMTMDVWMGAYLSQGSDLTTKDAGKRLSGSKDSFPKYLTDLGIEATPAYMLLSEATMRAQRRARELGYIDDSWLPHQTQAAAWEAIRLGRLNVSQEELDKLVSEGDD